MSDYHGHDIKNWEHYRTPRTVQGFYVDRHKGDRLVGRVALLLFVLLAVAMLGGIV